MVDWFWRHHLCFKYHVRIHFDPQNKPKYMKNQAKAPVEQIGIDWLILNIGHHLFLLRILYVPTRYLISLSALDASRYYFKFGNNCSILYKSNCLVSSRSLINGMYKLKFDSLYPQSLLTVYHIVEMKCNMMSENSSFLWHKHLSHISKKRIERLVKNEILLNLDFTNLPMFVDCIKGKQTKHTKKEATSSTQLLEMIHTDVCGPFDVPLFNGEKYFTIFIDDFLRYGYIYLLYEKLQAMNVLKVYIN